MNIYRFFILHEIIWSILFDICLCLIAPIVYIPHFCYKSIRSNFISRAVNSDNKNMFAYVFMLLVAGKAFAMFQCCFYRFVQSCNNQSEWFQKYIKFRMPFSLIMYYSIFMINTAFILVRISLMIIYFFSGNYLHLRPSPRLFRFIWHKHKNYCISLSNDVYGDFSPLQITVVHTAFNYNYMDFPGSSSYCFYVQKPENNHKKCDHSQTQMDVV